ncbi:hypothetical protein IWW55_006415 [Coemansia sp. RSA 2706]|nr:hypothetical protein IWW55_006415 [Coemansia sp. RSA 2706]
MVRAANGRRQVYHDWPMLADVLAATWRMREGGFTHGRRDVRHVFVEMHTWSHVDNVEIDSVQTRCRHLNIGGGIIATL